MTGLRFLFFFPPEGNWIKILTNYTSAIKFQPFKFGNTASPSIPKKIDVTGLKFTPRKKKKNHPPYNFTTSPSVSSSNIIKKVLPLDAPFGILSIPSRIIKIPRNGKTHVINQYIQL